MLDLSPGACLDRTPMTDSLEDTYAGLLRDFCHSGDQHALLAARALSRQFAEAAVSAESIMSIHESAAQSVPIGNHASELVASQRFLLEVMTGYAIAYGDIAERLLARAGADARAEHARAEDAERAEQDHLDLLAGVSHELGSPLTIVKGNVIAIRKFLESHGNWPQELTESEDDVEFAVERMLSLREELLAASRNEQRELELVPIHLVHCLKRVIRWAGVGAAEKDIRLAQEDSAKVPYVQGDEGAVQSIFSNLLSNALRYTPAGGSIYVRTWNQEASLVVEVVDTGIGISSAEQQRIFERFYRTPEAQKMATFGLGLGLAITRDLVTGMAGTIDVVSTPGAGSTFRVSFPVADLSEAG